MPSRTDRRLATLVRVMLAVGFLTPAVLLGLGLVGEERLGRLWVGTGFAMWGTATPGWVWLVPLSVQLALLVALVALGYLFVWAVVDPEG